MKLPRQTFFNLPEEKRQILLSAATKEFSRVSLGKASVANIVKDAEIPRGSFYQYFDDKEDLYFYLLNEHAAKRQDEFIASLNKNNGDIFESIKEMFHSMLVEMDDEGIRNFYKNVFLNMNYKIEKTFLKSINYSGMNKHYSVYKQLINRDLLNIENDCELFQMVQIVSMIMLENIVRKFAKELTNEEVIRNYTIQINLLKRGFVKK